MSVASKFWRTTVGLLEVSPAPSKVALVWGLLSKHKHSDELVGPLYQAENYLTRFLLKSNKVKESCNTPSLWRMLLWLYHRRCFKNQEEYYRTISKYTKPTDQLEPLKGLLFRSLQDSPGTKALIMDTLKYYCNNPVGVEFSGPCQKSLQELMVEKEDIGEDAIDEDEFIDSSNASGLLSSENKVYEYYGSQWVKKHGLDATRELSYPSAALPELSKFNFYHQKLAYQYTYLNNHQYPGSVIPFPYQRLSSPIYYNQFPITIYNPTSNPINPVLYSNPILHSTQKVPSQSYPPKLYAGSPTPIVTPYYLFSKCAGLEDFPQTISKLAAQFSSLDEDNNGLLSQEEWERDILKQIEKTNSGINNLFVNSVFNLVDKDGNSAMDFTELLQAVEMEGVNKDGEINQIEFELFWLKIQVSGGNPLVIPEMESSNSILDDSKIMDIAFKLLDLDGSNQITYTEFLQLDLDRDGMVGFLEFYYFLSRLALEDGVNGVGENDDENLYILQWLKEAKKLPLKMLKLSFITFDQADLDFNGGLDSLEYLRLKEGVIVAYSQESHKLLFDLNDMNGDGFITIEEEEALLKFAETEEEEEEESTSFVKFGPYTNENHDQKAEPRLMLRSDTNGDGKISKAEYIAQSEANIKCHINQNNIQLISDVLSFDMTITF